MSGSLLHLVYVAVSGSGEVLVLKEGAKTGDLAEVQRLHLGGAIMPMALSPDSTRLYAVSRTQPYVVHTLAIAPEDGRLTPLAATPLPGNMVYVAMTGTGRHLLTASYEEDFIAVHEIDTQGIVGGLVARRQTSRQAHAVRPSPSGDSLWVTCLGADEWLRFDQDPATGDLSLAPSARMNLRPGSGPRHFVFHPAMPEWCYLINEVDGTVDFHTLASCDGNTNDTGSSNNGANMVWRQSIAILPPDTELTPWAAELRVAEDGRWLFATDRRSGCVVSFSIDQTTGALSFADRLAVSGLPRCMAVSRSGERLLIAKQQSGEIEIVEVDHASGQFKAAATLAVGPSPTWVETLELPHRGT